MFGRQRNWVVSPDHRIFTTRATTGYKALLNILPDITGNVLDITPTDHGYIVNFTCGDISCVKVHNYDTTIFPNSFK